MTISPPAAELASLWSRHHARWRDGAQVASQWSEAAETDPKLLRSRTSGPWWELLDQLGITLLVTREYEHLAMALSVDDGQPAASFMRLPHPSGLVADRERGVVHVASTRNPNQLFTFAPVERTLARADMPPPALERRPLVPVGTRFYPGALYMHDLALIGGELHANAVGQNAVVRLGEHGATRVWWPRAVEDEDGVPDCSLNYLQVNSIAAGETLASSCFSASSAHVSARRPGHRNYPVDGRGVIFDGATREPLASGLTRPHSARFDAGELWVDNSGYGEVGPVAGGAFEPRARLGSWTRGLVFCGDVAFVGVSRVIPRYRQYAPGLEVERSVCGVVALQRDSGAELARLTWPYGNQIFALDWLPRMTSGGFPFAAGRRVSSDSKHLFYSFLPSTHEEFQHT
ncbi:DUF4915 domain-containing protein [Conexibacter sp. JD483]|uniref:DUF4915 domain-containing protein n=1 Tax=unclassified Conexibacter TaxID=2627773 RepID=UPI00271E38F2|nr:MULTISPECIES: DUF4915 domain-containing protein [unclassified Conexibacter]MDO8184191.1 DUF4915 domain-containing protein [Conexibacter sp. CPCC 205706]MDO8197183.1 DUF4915 domain-containing protein [Conexibacter sp. CPCC 205762]MDR9367502.1 DUF4915 domain-containing protein [Conexibacter sp. JD483]